jgi:serralysin
MPNLDFNGDGRDDILWRERGGGSVAISLAAEDGSFANDSAIPPVSVPSEWFILATGDFNGDGNDDIAWYNGRQLGNWFGQDDGGWIINDVLLGLDSPISIVAFAADFDGDGRDELLVTGHADQNPEILVLDVVFADAHGSFEFSMGSFASVAGNWGIAGVGDFDGDGQDDILWRSNDGTVGNWLATDQFDSFGATNGVINDWTINNSSLVQVSSDWQIVGVGDFNGDGADDILWRHDSGLLGNWLGGDSGVFATNNASLVHVPLDWAVVGTGDYDGDGTDDVLWLNINNHAVGTWSGTDSGVFITNPEPLAYFPSNWLIQPNPYGFGEWDY